MRYHFSNLELTEWEEAQAVIAWRERFGDPHAAVATRTASDDQPRCVKAGHTTLLRRRDLWGS